MFNFNIKNDMKKMILVSVALLALVSVKLFADKAVEPEEEYYMCMWSEDAGDCVDGSDNYCVCIK